MKRVLVVTKNVYLGQKIRLALLPYAETTVAQNYLSDFDICFFDLDSCEFDISEKNIITMSRTQPSHLAIPFSFDSLKAYVKTTDLGADNLSLNDRICTLRDKKIKLTELEAALLRQLIDAKGDFVTRDQLLYKVWGNEADEGVINVYIHYLREKLEDGEKIILSSRKRGYRIDEKYLGGEKNA